MNRSTWDEYFLRIAAEVASRATCDRAHVAAAMALKIDLVGPTIPGWPAVAR